MNATKILFIVAILIQNMALASTIQIEGRAWTFERKGGYAFAYLTTTVTDISRVASLDVSSCKEFDRLLEPAIEKLEDCKKNIGQEKPEFCVLFARAVDRIRFEGATEAEVTGLFFTGSTSLSITTAEKSKIRQLVGEKTGLPSRNVWISPNPPLNIADLAHLRWDYQNDSRVKRIHLGLGLEMKAPAVESGEAYRLTHDVLVVRGRDAVCDILQKRLGFSGTFSATHSTLSDGRTTTLSLGADKLERIYASLKEKSQPSTDRARVALIHGARIAHFLEKYDPEVIETDIESSARLVFDLLFDPLELKIQTALSSEEIKQFFPNELITQGFWRGLYDESE